MNRSQELLSALWTGYGSRFIADADTLAVSLSEVPELLGENGFFTKRSCESSDRGHVYFARRPWGVFKIGVSRKPRLRCHDIQAQSKITCDLRLLIVGASRWHESLFHKMLRSEAQQFPGEHFRGPMTEFVFASLCRGASRLGDIAPDQFDSLPVARKKKRAAE